MSCVIDNTNSIELRSDPSVFVAADGQPYNQKRDNRSRLLITKSRTACFTVNPEDFIRLELSFVNEVESVFVEPAPRRTGFHVFTIVNERDPEVRAKIYGHEQAIMDEFKNVEFDFRIIARRNRPLTDIITGLGNPTR